MSGQQTLQANEFKRHLRDSLERETRNSRAIKIARHDNVYTAGEPSETIYFIESGQIKLVIFSMEGKEGLLSIHSEGDIFGEMCLTGSGPRIDTATAMEATTLKQVSCSQFLECLR